MRYNPGDLVLIPFPFADDSTEKKRPVLVLTSTHRHDDFIGLAVTSVPSFDFAIPIENSQLLSGNLPKSSWVRLDKVFTLSHDIIQKDIGKLTDESFQRILLGLCRYLGCS